MITMEELFTVEDVAKALKLSEYKVRVMLRTGTIKGVKVDGQWRVRPADYRKYLDSLDSEQQEDKK